jgi:hypothetical protein
MLYIRFFGSQEYRLNEWINETFKLDQYGIKRWSSPEQFWSLQYDTLTAVLYYMLYHSNYVIFVSDRNVIFVVPLVSAC